MNNNPHLLSTDTGTGREALLVLTPVRPDRTLPKFGGELEVKSDGVLWTENNSALTATSTLTVGNFRITERGISKISAPLWERLWDALKGKVAEVYVRVKSTPVEETFEAILGGGKKLVVLTDRLDTHRAAIKETHSMGQTALAEQLTARTKVVEAEAVLFAAGRREYIDEKDLIRFAKECERGLRLDYMKNFTRLIPRDVRLKKIQMDALKVFDAYVILHYDPKGDGAELTKQEVAKKKDPILFGLIEGSRRLYHVGSWVDEYCDLTFGDLIDKFGEEVLTLK